MRNKTTLVTFTCFDISALVILVCIEKQNYSGCGTTQETWVGWLSWEEGRDLSPSSTNMNHQTIDDAFNALIRFMYHIGGGFGFPAFMNNPTIMQHAQRVVLRFKAAKATISQSVAVARNDFEKKRMLSLAHSATPQEILTDFYTLMEIHRVKITIYMTEIIKGLGVKTSKWNVLHERYIENRLNK